MNIDALIRLLQEERRKYGNIPVTVHTANGKPSRVVDVATFSTVWSRTVWIKRRTRGIGRRGRISTKEPYASYRYGIRTRACKLPARHIRL